MKTLAVEDHIHKKRKPRERQKTKARDSGEAGDPTGNKETTEERYEEREDSRGREFGVMKEKEEGKEDLEEWGGGRKGG